MELLLKACLPMVITLILFCILICGNLIYQIHKQNKIIKTCDKILKDKKYEKRENND